MEIPREIRKKLESSLPSHVLEFLTEKFIEAEQYCEKAKQLEKENGWLHQQLHQTLTNVMQSQQQGGLGYSQHSQNQQGNQQGQYASARFIPFEQEDEYPTYFVMRRGVPGSEMRRGGNRNTYAEQGGGQGGSQGGGQSGGQGAQGGGQGGGTGAYYEEVIPAIERPYRRHIPIHREEPVIQPVTTST